MPREMTSARQVLLRRCGVHELLDRHTDTLENFLWGPKFNSSFYFSLSSFQLFSFFIFPVVFLLSLSRWFPSISFLLHLLFFSSILQLLRQKFLCKNYLPIINYTFSKNKLKYLHRKKSQYDHKLHGFLRGPKAVKHFFVLNFSTMSSPQSNDSYLID